MRSNTLAITRRLIALIGLVLDDGIINTAKYLLSKYFRVRYSYINIHNIMLLNPTPDEIRLFMKFREKYIKKAIKYLHRYYRFSAAAVAGAYPGDYIIFLKSLGIKNIIGFEASPRNCARTKKILLLNGYQVSIECKALSAKNTVLEFCEDNRMWGHSRVCNNGIDVKAVPLNDYDIPKPCLILIDVEGHEIEVLKGATRHYDCVWIVESRKGHIFEKIVQKYFRFIAIYPHAFSTHKTYYILLPLASKRNR